MKYVIDTTKVGEMVGNIRYGTTVQFWFKALDGDSSDSIQIPIEFPTEALAIAVAEMTGPIGLTQAKIAAAA